MACGRSPGSAASRSRARCSRDLTVPAGTPSASAASSIDMPMMSQATAAARKSGSSVASAAIRSSRSSAERSRRRASELLDRLGGALAPVERVVGLAQDDPVDPGREAGVAAEAGDRPPGRDQPLLHAVAGVRPPTASPAAPACRAGPGGAAPAARRRRRPRAPTRLASHSSDASCSRMRPSYAPAGRCGGRGRAIASLTPAWTAAGRGRFRRYTRPFGAWRSLVAHPAGGRAVGGSNPARPDLFWPHG